MSRLKPKLYLLYPVRPFTSSLSVELNSNTVVLFWVCVTDRAHTHTHSYLTRSHTHVRSPIHTLHVRLTWLNSVTPDGCVWNTAHTRWSFSVLNIQMTHRCWRSESRSSKSPQITTISSSTAALYTWQSIWLNHDSVIFPLSASD